MCAMCVYMKNEHTIADSCLTYLFRGRIPDSCLTVSAGYSQEKQQQMFWNDVWFSSDRPGFSENVEQK